MLNFFGEHCASLRWQRELFNWNLKPPHRDLFSAKKSDNKSMADELRVKETRHRCQIALARCLFRSSAWHRKHVITDSSARTEIILPFWLQVYTSSFCFNLVIQCDTSKFLKSLLLLNLSISSIVTQKRDFFSLWYCVIRCCWRIILEDQKLCRIFSYIPLDMLNYNH